MVIEETDNEDIEVGPCYICGWVSPKMDMKIRSGVYICFACDDEFDQILVEDL